MTGSSLKLLGLASLNILIAIALSITYLTHLASKVQLLTEDGVTAFIREVSDISAGRRTDMDEQAVTAYFMDHVAENGTFTRTLRSDIAGVRPESRSMNKKDFIADVLSDLRQKENNNSTVTVEGIKITDDGRMATAVTSSSEKETIQITGADGANPSVKPVIAKSYCQQTIGLSNNHMMQIVSAACTTSLAPAEFR